MYVWVKIYVNFVKYYYRALAKILKTGDPEPSLPKSWSPTIQKNIASFKK